ncbi:MAG: pyrroline-5-carboxylate reductase [Bacillota bacterium]
MKLAIIGLGNMGTAILEGIRQAELFKSEDIVACDKKFSDSDNIKYREDYGSLHLTDDNRSGVEEADIVLLAVKPQIMEYVLEEIKDLSRGKLFISIAAGVQIDYIKNMLGSDAKVIRVMPNTPALINSGAAAISPGSNVTDRELKIAEKIFSAVGEAVIIEEKHMDAVTGLSGSGPAFIYILIEAMSDAGVLNGLPREKAVKLAAQTVRGSAEMVLKTGKHPAELKDIVTSPAGTTIAGLSVLEKRAFRSAIIEAVNRAAERSKELGSRD